MLEAIEAILAGDYLSEQRLMLAAKVNNRGDSAPLVALNDLVHGRFNKRA
jgi:NAD kinase